MSRADRPPSPFPSLQAVRLPASAQPRGSGTPWPCNAAAQGVGEQVRALRVGAALSGAALAKRACVSRSLLSRVERGLVCPSVETLGRIANALGVAMARLFMDPDQRSDFSHVPCDQGIAVGGLGALGDHCHELLGHVRSEQLCVEPYLVRVASTSDPCADLQHPGLKFVHLLSGSVRYRYSARVVDAQAGDSLLFEAGAPHGVEAVVNGPVSYLSLVVTLRG